MAKGTLYLIPTVISQGTQQKVISPEILQTLPNIKKFLVEDVRTSRRFISSLKLGIVIEELKFFILNKRTKETELYNQLTPLLKGEDIGILSESGCPGVADPGSLAVEMAHSMGVRVVPLVGPSSILLALMASGFNGQRFAFHGYLPIDLGERKRKIQELERESLKFRQTQLFMETPYRNEKLFKSILSTCRHDTRLCVAADVTGENEWIKTMPISKWKKEKQVPIHKIPTVFAILA